MQSVAITTNVVSSNLAQMRCTWYNTNKTDPHGINEILVILTLNSVMTCPVDNVLKAIGI